MNEKSHIHFIGIGGISMSSLAMIMNANGYKVTGSDIAKSAMTDRLSDLGIKVYIEHKAENVDGASLVVYTAAIKKDNPEYIKCQENNIPIVERSVFLGALMKAYKYPCCIAGTHGKTTTTSMVSLIMKNAGLDPTALVGGVVKELGGNLRIGKSDVFVTESCEYVESFLKFYPYKAIILNVDEDHLDYFKDMNHIISAFDKFTKLLPENGMMLVNGMDSEACDAVKNAKCEVLKFGIGDEFDVCAKNVVFDKSGHGCYDFWYKGEFISNIVLGIPGKHNVLNSLSAAAMCYSYGADVSSIVTTLKEFKGTDRRFEFKGKVNGVEVFDDYAHHPTEIKAALDTAKAYTDGRVIVVFQSHTYTRTYALLKEFSESFDKADKIIVTDIYAAREKDTGLVTPNELTDLIVKNGKDALYVGPFEDIVTCLKENTVPGDMVITIGAGTVFKVGEMFLK